MKYRCSTLLIGLLVVGTASAQGLVPTPPDTPPTPGFRVPVGVGNVPKNITKDTRWKAPDGYDGAAYEKALDAYKAAMERRPARPPKPA